jgi:putative lipoic acid-binding regulatory protein
MSGINREKPHLEYPCPWVYKIIGTDQDAMRSAVAEIVQGCPCRVSFSKQSETARYVSLNVELTVESESHRVDVYLALKAHPAVKMVL